MLAIVGRPNVGKSTFFNRLTQTRQAIVDSTAGVTRDRHYGKSDWNGVEFSVIDTGGYVTGSDDIFEEEIAKQVHLAIEEANSIVFVTGRPARCNRHGSGSGRHSAQEQKTCLSGRKQSGQFRTRIPYC